MNAQAEMPEAAATSVRPRRLGLLAHGFTSWGGGLDFLRGIATGLHHAAPSIELHVLAPTRGPLVTVRSLSDAARGLLRRSTMAAHRPHPDHLERALAGTDAILHEIDIGQRALNRATARLGLDALLPAIAPQPEASAPWVGYVFDFQHKHLPQFFTDRERALRDRDFRQMLDNASVVIVNARDVAKDIEHFFPKRKARVFALPFSPAPGSEAFSVSIADARQRHRITGPYFIVCNQFWKHKDHATAFKAFATLANKHSELSLVCTGATSDYRFPDYFNELMQQATQNGLANRIRILGLIPKPDQLALIRGAIALVQPTLFEGGPGGGAVYDAIAVGQRSIVSNIPVNTEIDDSSIIFFEAASPPSLATAMEHALALPPMPATTPTELIARGAERRRACGQVLLQAIDVARSY